MNTMLAASCALLITGSTALAGNTAQNIPAHIGIWKPLYTHEHMSSTAVIAFLFIPVYCTVTMLIGLGIGLGISYLSGWRTRNNAEQRAA